MEEIIQPQNLVNICIKVQTILIQCESKTQMILWKVYAVLTLFKRASDVFSVDIEVIVLKFFLYFVIYIV